MSPPWQSFSSCEITLDFADGEYRFRLPWRLIAELQQKRGVDVEFPDGSRGRRPKGLGLIWRELRDRSYDVGDLREVVRLGLIGGGGGVVEGVAVKVEASRAKALMTAYVDGGDDESLAMPTDPLWNLAFAILSACIQGYAAPGKA